jgi:uncharacterized protein YjiS (DUF1127 family)
VSDCAANGIKAVSFGGGEPLEYPGVFDVLARLRGRLFRSLTTNGLGLDDKTLAALVEAGPEKVHVSVHFPGDTERVIEQVHRLAARGIASGVNLLVSRSRLTETTAVAARLRAAGIGNDRVVYLPMRMQDTPTPAQIAEVAGGARFQSMTCLAACQPSARFCAIAWDKTVAWCSYTRTRRPLGELTYAALCAALQGLGLAFCGGQSDGPLVRLSGRSLDGHHVVRDRR